MTDTAKQAAPETVTITIDGRQVEAKPGEMLIAAAERAGTYIPRFCYHPRMRPVGMCRMCLVQVKGPRGYALQPSCFVPVADGQEVVTDSPEVKKAQDGILEFLLVNHPLDCPVCDKGGECPLQDQTFAYGPGETRFVEEKRHWEKPIALSDLVLIDRERCIQCDRCTRFADEIAGDPLIEFIGRGGVTEINTFPNEPFSSYFSGNTVQACPVGALLAKPYRFKARPWDLEQVESTCTACAVGCRIAVQSSADTLTRYIGIDIDPVNHGWLCDKGRFSYEAVNSDERVSAPLVKKGDQLVEASWGEALDATAQAIKDAMTAYGPDAVAFIGGARLTNEDAYAWAKLAKAVVRTDSVDCQLGDGLPAEVVLGLPRATIDDACSASAVVLLGPDIKEELPVLYLRLRGVALNENVPLLEVTPAATGLTRYTQASISYSPGQAAEGVRQLLQTHGDVLRNGPVVVVLGRPSLAEPASTILDAASVLVDELGDSVRFLPALRRGNVHGALDMGLAPGMLPGRVSREDGSAWFADGWGGAPEGRPRDTTDILSAAAGGEIKALVLIGADPAADFPDRPLANAALEGVASLIAVDCFLTESSQRADIVLPALTFAERSGTTTNLEGRISRLGKKVTGPGVAWQDWVIATELAVRLGADLGFEGTDTIWDEIERLAPSHVGITRQVLNSRPARDGVVAPLADHPPSARGPASVDPVATPGLVEVEDQGDPATEINQEPEAQTETADVDEHGQSADTNTESDSSPVRPPLVTARFAGPAAQVPPPDAYSLRLVSGRKLYDDGVVVRQSPSLRSLARPACLRINPYDLDRLGVQTGGQVRLRSPRLTTTIEVIADGGVPRGGAVLPFNLADLRAGDLIDVTKPVAEVAIETVR